MTLLRVFHSTETRFSASQGLRAFCETYNIGHVKGSSLVISAQDKQEIACLLKGKMGIDALTTYPESWDGLSRAESLNLAKDEKMGGCIVGEDRVQIKALAGQALSVGDGEWLLPDGVDMGFPLAALLKFPIRHGSILVVENKQTFHDLWQVREDILKEVAGTNPLVLFRGDAESGAKANATHRLIEATEAPVFAFVDYDPAGMLIANSLPRLDKLVAPEPDELLDLICAHGLSDRFLLQVARAGLALKKLETDQIVGPVLRVIMKSGKGLPQEFFHRDGRPTESEKERENRVLRSM